MKKEKQKNTEKSLDIRPNVELSGDFVKQSRSPLAKSPSIVFRAADDE